MCRPITKGNAGSNAANTKVKDTAAVGQGLQKTKLCKFFLSGRCRRGQACTFAHGEEALQPQPDLFKTQFCFQYGNTGTCSYGDSCSFAHCKEELRSSAPEVASNSDAGMLSKEDTFRFEFSSDGLKNEVDRLRSQSGMLEDGEHAYHASNGSSHYFSGIVANGSSSIGMRHNVAYVGLPPIPSAPPMMAQTVAPVAAVRPIAQEQSAPMVAVFCGPVGQCESSGMPRPALCSAMSRQTTEVQSSSGSLIEEDDGWASVASVSAGSKEGDSQAAEDLEVETAIVVKNTFITIEPMSDSVTKSESSCVRSSSAPPLNRG